MLVWARQFLGDRRGAIAPMTAVGLIALLGMGALAIDMGRLFNLHTELQHAVDSAALSGATQLDGNGGAMDRARAAAKGAFVTNYQRFSTDDAGMSVTIVDGDITFLQELVTRTVATSDANAQFIQVDLAPRSIVFFLAGIVGVNSFANVTAHAVAGLGSALCKVPPLMICNPVEPDAFDINDFIGSGMFLKSSGAGSPWAPGTFGLLALDGTNLSTNDLRDAMGRVNPRAACFGDVVSTNPGQSTAVRQGFNVRFDMYDGPQAASLQTDWQYQPARNTIKGRTRAGTQCGTGGQGWQEPANQYEGPNDADGADAMSLPRDDCAYPAPGGTGTCTVDSGVRISKSVAAGGVGGVSATALQHYFDVNHNAADWRMAMGAAAPLAPAMPRRFDVYEWEKANMYPAPGTMWKPEGAETGYPECYTGPNPDAEPDRRTISTVIINCVAEGVKGFTPDVTVVGTMDLFALEPMSEQGNANLLYVEVIGPTGPGTVVGEETAKTFVQLYE